MELVGEFLPVLLLLYLVDSAFFVRGGQQLFVSGWHGRFAASGPGLRFPGLLPHAEAYLTSSLPLRISAEGLRMPARGGERLVPFDGMWKVKAAGGEVRVDSRTSLPVRPKALASEVAAVLERLRTTPAPRRGARLQRELRRRSDLRAIDALRARQARPLRLLRALSLASALAMAVVLPASLIPELAWRPSPSAALTLVAVLYLTTLAVSIRLLRQCDLRGRAVGRAVLPLLLFPPAVAHAPSLVTRELFLAFEPLALAARLLDRPAFARLLRGAHGGPIASAATGEPWDVENLVRKLVRTSAAREDRNRPRPRRSDASASGYCPSCLTEYRTGFSRCSDCDQPLVPYDR